MIETFHINIRRGAKPSHTEKIVIDGDSYWELFHEIEMAIVNPDVTSFSVRKPRRRRSEVKTQ